MKQGPEHKNPKKIPLRKINPALREPELSGSFAIRATGPLLNQRDMVQELHRHDFFFILAVEKGTGIHQIDFTSYKITAHSVFLMRPGQVHELQLKKGSTGFLLEFDPGFYAPRELPKQQVLRRAGGKNHCQLSAARFEKLLGVLRRMHDEFHERQSGYREAIRSYLDLFFLELVRQSQNPRQKNGEKKPYSQERLEELQELIETHITTHKQVAQYAALMHLTPYQLNAVTRAGLGKTCSALIDEQIILEAKRQLLSTTLQVNEVAYALGYEDASYFIRFFRRHTGHTPESFRQNFS